MMWGSPGYGYGYADGGGSWLGMAFMMFFGLLFLAGLVVLIIWMVRAATPRQPMYPSGTTSACDIAKLRFARGEITKEQFEEICRLVGG